MAQYTTANSQLRQDRSEAVLLPPRVIKFPLSKPETVEMESEHRMPSPIERNPGLQLLHNNMNSSSASSQLNGYC